MVFPSRFPLVRKTGSRAVQTRKELICPKGKVMNTHKAGLHKDVSTIFDGVWDPEQDNLQLSLNEQEATLVAYANPKAMALDDWPTEKRPKLATLVKVFAEAPGHLFRSRARREKKRLLSISKHLLINQPG